jgi:hypothetical protein
MLFDFTFPCYLTTFSGKKCLSGKIIVLFFVPLIEVLPYYLPSLRRGTVRERSVAFWGRRGKTGEGILGLR